jgi:quercetin dioxygenase-like cupin family protein
MTKIKTALLAFAGLTFCLAALPGAVHAQELKRTELQRHDLTGTNMEVVVSLLEAPPGVFLPKHFHHGEEAFYVLDGAMVEYPDQPPTMRATGSSGINVREVPHAGYKVVGDKALKLLTVHIVDKGKPLQERVQ